MKYRQIAFILAIILPLGSARAAAPTDIVDLRVQHEAEPLCVEEGHPSFSWKMNSGQRGQSQQAYRIRVRRAFDGSTVWDSGLVRDSLSVDRRYQGVALQPTTDYLWDLTVIDRDGGKHEASSRFATGLMSPKLSAWKGAGWIGSTAPALDAASLSLFSISADITFVKGTCAGFLFGADDFRLKSTFHNSFNLAGDNYFKVLLDLGGTGSPDGAQIRIYRVGYAATDRPDRPLLTIDRSHYPGLNLPEILRSAPSGTEHRFKLDVRDGTVSFEVDGQAVRISDDPGAARFTLSPLGAGSEINLFPHLCSVGFAAEPGSDVTYTDYRIEAGGCSQEGPLFHGAQQYRRFEGLSCVRLPRYRNQSDYEMDIVVVNKGEREVVEYIDPSFGGETLLRSEFTLPPGRKIRSARVYASALGIYRLYLNGQQVAQDLFAPGVSQYRERVTYQAYEVTPLLRTGRNAIGAELFDGWFAGAMSPESANYNFYGDTPALLFRLDLCYEDGRTESVLSTPEGWKRFDGGPVRAGSFFQGERYDARCEEAVRGWTEPGYDDSAWPDAEAIRTRDWVHPDITARGDGLVREREVLQAKERKYLQGDDYTFIYDMGETLVGVPEIHIPAGWLRRGEVVVLRYAGRLYPGEPGDSEEDIARYGAAGRNIAGHLRYEDNGAAMDADFYTAAGDGAVVIRPRSTWRPYRYIQITIPSHAGPLPLQNVKGIVLSSCEAPTGTYEAVTAEAGRGERAEALLHRIQRRERGEFLSLPTFRPERSESSLWAAEAQERCRTDGYNADVLSLFSQWMTVLRDDQGIGSVWDVPGSIAPSIPAYTQGRDTRFAENTACGAAVCLVPWQLYTRYGDKRILEENLEAMVSWLNGMAFYPLSGTYPYLSAKAGGMGDWGAPDAGTPPDLVNNALYIHCLDVTARMAEILAQEPVARMLRERSRLARMDWNRAYVDPLSGRTRALDGTIVHSQTSYATPLRWGVFDELSRPRAEEYLCELVATPSRSGPDAGRDFPDWTPTTGLIGTADLLPALTAIGKIEEAYALFAEALGDDDAPEAFGEWMYACQLGITDGSSLGSPGYKHFVLQPVAGGDYRSLQGSFESEYGRIESRWSADGAGRMTAFETTVPANASATLFLPVCETAMVFDQCEGALFQGTVLHNGLLTACYELTSGSFRFTLHPTGIQVQ